MYLPIQYYKQIHILDSHHDNGIISCVAYLTETEGNYNKNNAVRTI